MKQATRAWYERLATFLLEHSFQRGSVDKTLFIKREKHDILIAQVYVDDIVFGSTSETLSASFATCMAKEFEMSMVGELSFFLGLQIKQSEHGIFLSQSKYAHNILK